MKYFRYTCLGTFFLLSLVYLIMFSTLRTYDYKNKENYVAEYKSGYLIFKDNQGEEMIKLLPISKRINVSDNQQVNIWYNQKDDDVIVMNGIFSYWDFFKSIIFSLSLLLLSVYLIIKEYYIKKK